ncbi:MAG TPA: AbrB family transcriptional regulator [Candidatus Dormibacteraeota bacterium]|jgi:bifunctional DNA-binding transcriptional regulator/antitoxin component of YhaV-PrlF toxin-antitoxin module|nr:AbrB family transcriptional regulator [Candidatus Dormibacteraeota bacterium]
MGEKAVVRRVDQQGRVAIPVDWRSEWKSDKVMLVRKGRRIELAPVEPIDPTSLFDSIVVPDSVDFSDSHSLKRAFLSRRKEAR